MKALVDLAAALGQRLPVRRIELSRKGALLVELSGDGEPRWLAVEEGGARELVPEQDEALPLAGRLAALRETQAALVVAWRPGRRMVVRVRREGAPAGAFVKALRAGRLRQALERHIEGARAAREAGLVAAAVLTVEPPSASFALADLGAEPVPVGAAQVARYERLGAALARFQRVGGGPELARHDAAAELDVLDALATKVGRLGHRLPEGWETARGIVGAALEALAHGPRVRAHRDLHDRQLLAQPEGGVALLDFDLLCAADEALDPANLLAHLELRELQGLASRADVAACAEAFRTGYGRLGDAGLERRLAAWRAAALLRLALVYRLRPPYAELGPVLVERAQAWLREVRRGAV